MPLQAFQGLAVTAVLKYSDAIVKNFAGALGGHAPHAPGRARPTLAHLAPSLAHLAPSLAHLAPTLAHLAPTLAHLARPTLAHLWAVRAASLNARHVQPAVLNSSAPDQARR